MSKILGSWSGMRNYLESEMLADTLKRRVVYSCTKYPGMDGCGTFEIRVDGEAVKRFSMKTVIIDELDGAEPNEKFWDDFNSKMTKTPLNERKEFDDYEFAEALTIYRNISISKALSSNNPIVRIFAILDRRVGKRTLEKIESSIKEQPEWLQYFYRLRVEAEKP